MAKLLIIGIEPLTLQEQSILNKIFIEAMNVESTVYEYRYLTNNFETAKAKDLKTEIQNIFNSLTKETGCIIALGDKVAKVLGKTNFKKVVSKILSFDIPTPLMLAYDIATIIENQKYLYSVAKDLNKAYEIATDTYNDTGSTIWRFINTFEELEKVVSYIKQTGVCAFDFETVKLDDKKGVYHQDFKATTLSLSFQAGSGYVLPLEHFQTTIEPVEMYLMLLLLKEQVFENPEINKIGHNLSFDAHVLNRYKIGLEGKLDDTMLMHHLIDETQQHGLKELVAEYYPEYAGYDDELAGMDWAKIPLGILSKYNAVDSDMTLRLKTILEAELQKDEPSYIIYRNLTMPCWKSLFQAECEGMLIDADFIESKLPLVDELRSGVLGRLNTHPIFLKYFRYKKREALKQAIAEKEEKLESLKELAVKKFEKTKTDLEEELKELLLTKDERHKSVQLRFEKLKKLEVTQSLGELKTIQDIQDLKTGNVELLKEFNFGSPTQLADLLYKCPVGCNFPSIDYKTGKEFLEELDDSSGFMQDLLLLRVIEKTTGTYLKGLLDRLDKNNRVHTAFLLAGTQSGRLSSKNPNLQNISNVAKLKDEEAIKLVSYVKESFIVPKGYTLVSLDYAQAELRVIASFAQETAMLEAFENDLDLHSLTASVSMQITIEEFFALPKTEQKAGRTKAKAVNFGLIYGMSAKGFMNYAKVGYGVILTLEESETVRNAFFDKYSKLVEYHEIYQEKARKFGWVRTLFGRRRRTPNINSPSSMERSADERVSINCVTEDTSILTDRGWLDINTLTTDDVIYTINPETGKLEKNNCLRINKQEVVNLEMVEIENNAISCISTKNHRWLVDSKRTKGVKKDFITSDKLSNHGDHRIWLCADYSDLKGDGSWIDDEVILIGWILTDGHFKERKRRHGGLMNTTTVGVSQVKEANLQVIEDLFIRLGYKYSHIVSKRGQHFWNVSGELGRRIKSSLPKKTLNMKFLRQLSTNQLHLLYDTMLLGDGSNDSSAKRYRKFTSGTEERADAFLMLCALIGKPAVSVCRDMSKYTPISPKMHNIPKMGNVWSLELKQRKRAYANIGKSLVTYSGTIWCPTVENGTWIAKRNGKMFITGNSPIQGSAGEFTLFAISLLTLRLNKRTLFINTVHDSIMFYVPDELLEKEIPIMVETASNLPTEKYFNKTLKGVKMKVDVEVSKESWKKLQEYENR